MAIPTDVQIPKGSSQFTKLDEGKTKVRVLSDAILGWEGWKDKKPFRVEGSECTITEDQVDMGIDGKPNINYFWAFEIWNYAEESIQTWEITQKTIMGTLYDLEQNPDWGDLKGYDIEINKKKEGDRTLYSVIAIPPKELDAEIAEAYEASDIDMRKIFEGEYPISE